MNQEQLNSSLIKFAGAGNLSIVKALVRAGATKDDRFTAVRLAALKGHLDMVKYLLGLISHDDELYLHLIQIGIMSGHADLVHYLLPRASPDFEALKWALAAASIIDHKNEEIIEICKGYFNANS